MTSTLKAAVRSNGGAQRRKVSTRTRGDRHGPITRLVSPGYLGEHLKPFVFLDLFDFVPGDGKLSGFGLHPHSGIATLTFLWEGNVRYEDTNGATGLLPAGGLEWMKAGAGVWHGGGAGDTAARGFQLWLALPPEHELGASESRYLAPAEIPQDGPARVLLGSYGSATSPIPAPAPINYLAVTLKAGKRWLYQAPAGHSVLWLAMGRGAVAVPDRLEAGELAVFDQFEGGIEIEALEDAQFVLGSARPHPHELHLGSHSVHTSRESLRRGERRIAEIRGQLLRDGKL